MASGQNRAPSRAASGSATAATTPSRVPQRSIRAHPIRSQALTGPRFLHDRVRPQPNWVARVALGESVHDQEVFVRFRRRILPLGGLVAVLSTAIAMILAGGPAALAATTSTSLHDVLSQLRRNS